MVGPQFTPGPSDTAPLAAVRAEPAAPPGRDVKALALKGAGLVVIAVVAGLVWYLIRHDSTTEPVAQPAAATSPFDYQLVDGPDRTGDCAAKSYDDTRKYFDGNPCSALARALYTVKYGDAKALVSVAKVSMPTAAQATQLKQLTDRDGTGNVSDLVRDGSYKAKGAPKVSSDQAEYESEVTGTDVTIVLADFYDRHRDDALLKRIATDALKLSDKLG